MADQKIINSLKKYIQILNSEGFEITRAFLYGSQVSGNAHEASDIDLMLISKNLDDNDVKKKSKAWTLTRNEDTRIEPYLVSQSRFEGDMTTPLLEVIRNQGLEIQF